MAFKKKDGPDKVQARINEIAKWLRDNYPNINEERKHEEKGSSERGYYMFGYMMALIDMIEVLKRMGITWKLD